MKPRKWVNEHREELRKEFVGKTVLVCEDRVVKVFEGPINPLRINEEARRICKKEWCYTYLPESEEEYLL